MYYFTVAINLCIFQISDWKVGKSINSTKLSISFVCCPFLGKLQSICFRAFYHSECDCWSQKLPFQCISCVKLLLYVEANWELDSNPLVLKQQSVLVPLKVSNHPLLGNRSVPCQLEPKFSVDVRKLEHYCLLCSYNSRSVKLLQVSLKSCSNFIPWTCVSICVCIW